MKRFLISAGKWLVMVLFMSYYISTTCFYHTHNFSWGQITHSHPYFPLDKGQIKHIHTQEACQTIDHLSNILIVLFAATILLFKANVTRSVYTPIYCFISYFKYIGSPFRGPPCLSLIS